MKKLLEFIPAKFRRIFIMTSVILTVVVMLIMFNKDPDKLESKQTNKILQKGIADRNVQYDLNINSLSNKLDNLIDKVNNLQDENNNLKEQINSLLSNKSIIQDNNNIMDNTNQNISNNNIDPLYEYSQDTSTNNNIQIPPINNITETSIEDILNNKNNLHNNWELKTNNSPPIIDKVINNNLTNEFSIKSYTTLKDSKFIIPTNSLLSGVMITGVDAPTNETVRKDPLPLLIRLTDLSVLPNKYRSDIKGCFVLMSSYGDLSSERVYMRSESISCINNKKQVFSSEIQGFAVGIDGKNGISGHLVSKQGSLIGRSLAAGFLQSISQAFSKGVNINPIGLNKEQTTNLLQQSSLKGSSDAIGKISQFYLNLANNMFPLIELNAGQPVDIVLTAPINFDFNSKSIINKLPLNNQK